jgi:chitinase
VAIADTSVTEGNSGTKGAAFTVTLSPASAAAIAISYATANGTAAAGSDYTAVSGTLTFNPGQTQKVINVPIIGDTADEPDETFLVQLTTAANVDLADRQAVGTIVDDDGLPALSVADAVILEGNSGAAPLQFAVTLSPPSPATVTVQYATANGSATAGSDYTAASGTLTFAPGQTSKTISVNVLGDIVDEGAGENFTLRLSNPANATLADSQAVGTITDDDEARLTMQTTNPQVAEGDSGVTPLAFTVSLSPPAAFVVTVDYAASSGFGANGALAGEDFIPAAGALVFQPGETSKSFNVPVIGDTRGESDEIFWVQMNNGSVPMGGSVTSATILNDDLYRTHLPLVLKP